MKNKLYYLLFALFLCSCATLEQEKLNYPAPAVIPDTTRAMKSAGFWIDRCASCDKIILTSQAIASFNNKIEKELNLITNLLNRQPQYNGSYLRKSLRKDIENISQQSLYDKNGRNPGKNFYAAIRTKMNLSLVPDTVNVRYGFISQCANQRILPTEEILTVTPNDIEFDELQNSSLDVGTPIIILHESLDKAWVYVDTATSSGWVKSNEVVFCGETDFKDYLKDKDFIIITSAKSGIFLDENLNKYYDYVRMGAKFNLSETSNPEVFEILLPSQTSEGKFLLHKAYIKKENANRGYLAYSARNIIEQAFKLLNAPYGWGGVNGEQDCSSYLQEIFLTVGITLPRNSYSQGKTGTALGQFKGSDSDYEKLAIIKRKAIPGATILRLNGHVALYLGMYNNKPYVIHETHGYGEVSDGKKISRIVNRVIVSDLSLGEGSRKGSLLSRIINVQLIGNNY